jgi:LysR family glycine cleavage system transcriptional activator
VDGDPHLSILHARSIGSGVAGYYWSSDEYPAEVRSDSNQMEMFYINADNANVDFDQSDMHAAVRFGKGKWPGLEILKLTGDWILPVCSQQLLDEIGPINSVEELQQHDLIFLDSDMWDPWFRKMGRSTRDPRWSQLDDSISILMAAEQGEGIALSRWSLVARDIEAGRLVRPIDAVVKTGWSSYFVAPPHYFDLPKVAVFRDWLLEHFSQFELPE